MVVVDYRLRVFDLSSEVPHRPTVSNSSPPHSSSPSKSLQLGGLTVDSDGYTLPLEPSEILTPEINRLMSPDTSPKLVPGFERYSTTVNRRGIGADSLSSVDMNAFTKWDRYKQSNGSRPSVRRSNSIRSHASLRRTDFTSRTELRRQGRNKGLIFHRGFLKRQSNNQLLRVSHKATRNRAELNAVLNYADLQTFNPEDVISATRVIMYRPNSLTKRDPGVSITAEIPLNNYVGRKPAIRRLPRGNSPIIRRSNTCPSSVRSMRRACYTPEASAIHDVWQEYLSVVIAQRVQLLLSLRCNDSQPSLFSDGGANELLITSGLCSSSTKSSLISAETRLSSLRICS